jgi:hypothetical protein
LQNLHISYCPKLELLHEVATLRRLVLTLLYSICRVFVIVVCVRLPLNCIKLIAPYLYSTECLFLVLFAFLKRTIEVLYFPTLIPRCEFVLGRWMFYLQVRSFPLDVDVTENFV